MPPLTHEQLALDPHTKRPAPDLGSRYRAAASSSTSTLISRRNCSPRWSGRKIRS